MVRVLTLAELNIFITLQPYKKLEQDLKIYGLSVGSLLFSGVSDINPFLQFIVLILTIVYTGINIYKIRKK